MKRERERESLVRGGRWRAVVCAVLSLREFSVFYCHTVTLSLIVLGIIGLQRDNKCDSCDNR